MQLNSSFRKDREGCWVGQTALFDLQESFNLLALYGDLASAAVDRIDDKHNFYLSLPAIDSFKRSDIPRHVVIQQCEVFQLKVAHWCSGLFRDDNVKADWTAVLRGKGSGILRVDHIRATQKRQKRNAETFDHERPNPSKDPLATVANLINS